MYKRVYDYIKNEMHPEQGKVSFYTPKLFLLASIIIFYIWSETLGNEKPLIYWILFFSIIAFGMVITILTYIGKRKKRSGYDNGD